MYGLKLTHPPTLSGSGNEQHLTYCGLRTPQQYWVMDYWYVCMICIGPAHHHHLVARVVLGSSASKSSHSTDTLRHLHWLLVEYWIKFKLAKLVFNTRNNNAPLYLTCLLDDAVIQTIFWCSQFPCCSCYCLELSSCSHSCMFTAQYIHVPLKNFFILMLLLTSDCSGHLVTLSAPPIPCLCVDFVRVTNFFNDYDHLFSHVLKEET